MIRMRIKSNGVSADISIFRPEAARAEAHAILLPSSGEGDVRDQLVRMENALRCFLAMKEGAGLKVVMKRIFLSDPANQISAVKEICGNDGAALSVIGQSPLYGAVKAGMMVIFISEVNLANRNGLVCVERGNYSDFWFTGGAIGGVDSYEATKLLFHNLTEGLKREGLTLERDCHRTWIYVRDIDNRYRGMVKARNEVFREEGLTDSNHFIASTGIEGTNAVFDALATMDAYSAGGLERTQTVYLKGETHLNRTSDYGVSFERGTAIIYGDRRHVFISGTASIDNKGQVVAPGNIVKQAQRMIENVNILLNEGAAKSEDIMHIIVYVRDIADSGKIKEIMEENYPHIPYIIVQASVCRPGWLVEMECMAITDKGSDEYAPY